jgi:hypothetical protein
MWRMFVFGNGVQQCVLTETVTGYYSWVRITRCYQFLLSTDIVQLWFDPKVSGVSWDQPWVYPVARTVLNSFWYSPGTDLDREKRDMARDLEAASWVDQRYIGI